MSAALVLQIEGLTVALPRRADRRAAVRAVDLAVGAGEIVCLVGESGSGKSVIALAVMGLLPAGLRAGPGRVLLAGEDLLRATPERMRALRGARIGMIFQEPMTALNPVMRCGAQLDEVLACHTDLAPAQRRARILDMMVQVRLPEPPHIYDAYPHELSGGQRQRIVIAMALMLDPVLLIADEPTTALDVTTQAEILRLIRELQAAHGTAVLFITHDFGVVADIAHRVAVLQLGDVVEQGDARSVLERPQHPYTRKLLAAVPGMVPPQRSPVAAVGQPVLECRGLSKTYRRRALFGRAVEVAAVRDVAFEVRRGETVGIVGESGSGKSTVARCAARLIDPSGGQLLIDGAAVGGHKGAEAAFRRRVQIVFQDPYRSLNPRRTVGDAIVEGPLNFGVDRAAAWAGAARLMQLVHLPESALTRYPHEFSGGQRQRLCIARALALEPELLIADEAVSALDVSVQAQILALLRDIQDRLSLALLFITHDLRVAAQLCHRILVMKNGRIVEQGETHRVFARPTHAYTRSLLAAAPGAAGGLHGAGSGKEE